MLVIGAYLLIVYRILPAFMKKRQPYDLTWIIRIYNVIQIEFCILCVFMVRQMGFKFTEVWKCFTIEEDNRINMLDIDYYLYFFVLMRMSEFVETFFFILRKRNDQVSFLHVYHHIAVAATAWIFLKHNVGVMGLYVGMYNNVVHIVMYSYYLMSSFRAFAATCRKLKPYLTLVQIAQLVFLMGQCYFALLPSCPNNRPLFIMQGINIFVILLLFIEFYMKSYIKIGVKKIGKKLQ
jgi:hypothetical protein